MANPQIGIGSCKIKLQTCLGVFLFRELGCRLLKAVFRAIMEGEDPGGLRCFISSSSFLSLAQVHFFNSFFYDKLRTKGYDGVKRWTKNVSYEFIPTYVNILPLKNSVLFL